MEMAAVGAWYLSYTLWSVLEPDTRSTLSDIAFILAFIIALAATMKILWSWAKTPRRILGWFWRRTWGRDDHGVWLTPTVRLERRIQSAVDPKMDKQTSTLLLEVQRVGQAAKLDIGAFRHESTAQHTRVEDRLSSLEESHHTLSERLVAVETALRITDRQ